MHGRVADREANPIISTFGGQHHAASPLVPISMILRVQSQVAIYFRLLLSLQSLAENHPLDFLQPNFLLSIREWGSIRLRVAQIANCNQHGTISSLLGLSGVRRSMIHSLTSLQRIVCSGPSCNPDGPIIFLSDSPREPSSLAFLAHESPFVAWPT